MKTLTHKPQLILLILLIAVGQMAQTIYIPAMTNMAASFQVREGAIQSVMAAYLLTYGLSQLFYGPISDLTGRRPVILVGMSVFMLATLVAATTPHFSVLVLASGLQGMGTGVAGVMNIWTLLVPAALFFFGAGMVFPLATSGAMEPFPFLAGTAGALVGGLQNMGAGSMAWLSALLPQTSQSSVGMLMTAMGLVMLGCWLPLALRQQHHRRQPV